MSGKRSKLYGIFNNKCPRCHKGAFFKYKASFNVKKVTIIHKNCTHCNLKFMMEPSFFFGAMYVNYVLAVTLFIIIFIISKVLLHQTILTSFIAVIFISFLLIPFTLRLSRIIWINLFIKFDNAISEKAEK